jgi:hypothetical protein
MRIVHMITAMCAVGALVSTTQARAEEPVTVETSAGPTYAERNIGVGAIIGDPTALSFKLRFDDNNALQLGVGWGFIEPFGDRITMLLDYLFHFTILDRETWRAGLLQPYIGFGGKLGVREEPDAVTLGGRMPLGLAFQIRPVPLEIFLEVAPGILIIPGLRGTVDGGIGARFYF